MKKYKFTVTFEVEDNDNSIEQSIQEKGLAHVEEQIAIGFMGPDFIGTACTIKETK